MDDSKKDKELDMLINDLKSEKVLSEIDFKKMPDSYTRFKFRVETTCLKLTFYNEFFQCLFIAEVQK
jgi:hypothetical protein